MISFLHKTIFIHIPKNAGHSIDIMFREMGMVDEERWHDRSIDIIERFGKTTSSELTWKSENNIDVEEETAEKLFKLLNVLEDNEDVQSISSNFEVNDEVLQSLVQ